MRVRTGPRPAIGPQMRRVAAPAARRAVNTGTPTFAVTFGGCAATAACDAPAEVSPGVEDPTKSFESPGPGVAVDERAGTRSS